eukprot:jgi/Chlat1/2984/Chrsp2S04712
MAEQLFAGLPPAGKRPRAAADGDQAAAALARRLLESDSIAKETGALFFEILTSAMADKSNCSAPALRVEYAKLFAAAGEYTHVFTKPQRAQLEVFQICAVLANELYTDDSFQFAAAGSRIRELIASLPDLTAEDEEFATTTTKPTESSREHDILQPTTSTVKTEEVRIKTEDGTDEATVVGKSEATTSDPFGLDAFLPLIQDKKKEKEERAKRKREEREREDEARRGRLLLAHDRRENVLHCIRTAFSQYKLAWAKAAIDLIIKAAHDNVLKFDARQREEVERLWVQSREKQVKRKVGGGVDKDKTAFERDSNRWRGEKISIRSSLGAGGDHQTEVWLG